MARVEVTITGDRCVGWEEREGQREMLLLPSIYPSPFIFPIEVSLCVTVVSISHLNQVFGAAISGHPVAMTTLATLGHGAVGAHSGASLFFSLFFCSLVSHRLSLRLLPFSRSLFFAQNAEKTISLCFFTPPFPLGSCITIPLSLTLLSPLCVMLSVSLSVKRQSVSRAVESWQTCLSCGVPTCQTYQSCVPAYLPVSDDDKSACLV